MAFPNWINNYIYFYHLDKFCAIPMYPEDLTDNLQSSFASSNALARSAPVFTYSYSGPRVMTITLSIHRDALFDANYGITNFIEANPDLPLTSGPNGNLMDFTQEDYADVLIKYIQASSLPKYSITDLGAKSVIPPMVAIRFGDEIFIKGVINGAVNVQYKKPLITYRDGSIKYAELSMTFTVNETTPFDADSVAEMGSFRGFTNAFKDGNYSGENVNSNQNLLENSNPDLPDSPNSKYIQPSESYLEFEPNNKSGWGKKQKPQKKPDLVDPAQNRGSLGYKNWWLRTNADPLFYNYEIGKQMATNPQYYKNEYKIHGLEVANTSDTLPPMEDNIWTY